MFWEFTTQLIPFHDCQQKLVPRLLATCKILDWTQEIGGKFESKSCGFSSSFKIKLIFSDKILHNTISCTCLLQKAVLFRQGIMIWNCLVYKSKSIMKQTNVSQISIHLIKINNYKENQL